MRIGQKYLLFLGFFLSMGIYVVLGYFTERSNFFQLNLLFGILFLIYFLFLKYYNGFNDIRVLIGAAFTLRVIFLFQMPNLSDDYFRFIWDGRLLANGNNPYLYLPSEIVGTDFGNKNNLNIELFNGLNSKSYYSCYPPVHQLVFAVAAFICPNDIWGSVVVIRCFIVLAELGNLFLLIKILHQLQMKKFLLSIYAFNPLVVVELSGNLHFEGIFVFFILLSFYFWNQNKIFLSGLVYALSVGVKLLPLIFMPAIVQKLGKKNSFLFFIVVFATIGLMFLPFLSENLIHNFLSSINLYFQKFEFNASIYYIIRYIGYYVKGYDIIAYAGPVLSFISFIFISSVAILYNNKNRDNIFQVFVISLSFYFFFSTTVHPWYIVTLVAMSVFTNYRFPIVWSSVIILSYYAYRHSPYQENLWLISIEYTIVFLFLIIE